MTDKIGKELRRKLDKQMNNWIEDDDYTYRDCEVHFLELSSALKQHEETKKATTEEYEKYLDDYKKEVIEEIKRLSKELNQQIDLWKERKLKKDLKEKEE